MMGSGSLYKKSRAAWRACYIDLHPRESSNTHRVVRIGFTYRCTEDDRVNTRDADELAKYKATTSASLADRIDARGRACPCFCDQSPPLRFLS